MLHHYKMWNKNEKYKKKIIRITLKVYFGYEYKVGSCISFLKSCKIEILNMQYFETLPKGRKAFQRDTFFYETFY